MDAHSLLASWGSFYVSVGSSAAVLTGLMFVVITLSARSPQRTPDTINAFATPNLVHFMAVAFLAANLSAPWQNLRNPAYLIGAIAIAGVVYVLLVLRRVRRQTGYKPVLEDWIWHLLLPMAAYATLFVGAAWLAYEQPGAMFDIGAVALVLLAIGIHNAWDTVTYIVISRRKQ